MSTVKRAAVRFIDDLFAGWRNVYRLTAKAMASSSVVAVLLTFGIGIAIGVGFIAMGASVAGDVGAWAGSFVGIIVGGLFVGGVLDEL